MYSGSRGTNTLRDGLAPGMSYRLSQQNDGERRYFLADRESAHAPVRKSFRGVRRNVGVYDNTANNPNNPFSPPREIIGTNGSMKVTDEMFQLIMTYLPYQPGDENVRLER